MSAIGMREVVLIVCVALMLFGGKGASQVGKLLGKTFGDFKSVSELFRGKFK